MAIWKGSHNTTPILTGLRVNPCLLTTYVEPSWDDPPSIAGALDLNLNVLLMYLPWNLMTRVYVAYTDDVGWIYTPTQDSSGKYWFIGIFFTKQMSCNNVGGDEPTQPGWRVDPKHMGI